MKTHHYLLALMVIMTLALSACSAEPADYSSLSASPTQAEEALQAQDSSQAEAQAQPTPRPKKKSKNPQDQKPAVPEQNAALIAPAAPQESAALPGTQTDQERAIPANPGDLQQAAPAGIGGGEPAAEQPVPTEQPAPSGRPTDAKIGAQAPDFELQSLNGERLSLASLRGRYILINYWASWCIPCQSELDILEQLSNEYRDQGLVVVTINAISQDSLDKVQDTINQHRSTFPVLLDEGDAVSNLYNVMFFPTSFLIDADGVVRGVILGSTTEQQIRDKVERLLAGSL